MENLNDATYYGSYLKITIFQDKFPYVLKVDDPIFKSIVA